MGSQLGMNAGHDDDDSSLSPCFASIEESAFDLRHHRGAFMQERNFLLRFLAVPLGHKLIAAIIAVALAVGIHAWFRHYATQSASTAELSFNPSAEGLIDYGIVSGSEPAVALADSILNDQVVAALSKQTNLSSSPTMSRIGEFRARLQLTQPSDQVLRVGFHDADPVKSAAMANAVASTLTTWTPPPSAPPAPMAISRSTAPPVRSPQVPAVRHQEQALPALSASLGELEAQLSSASRELDRLSPTGKTRLAGRPQTYGESPYTQSKEQQILKAAVKAAQKTLDDLRLRYANEYAQADIKNQLTEIQRELFAIWPGNDTSMRSAGSWRHFNAAGTNASQLRRERAQLTFAISDVAKQRQVIMREEGTRSPSSSAIAAKAPPPQPQPAPVVPAPPAAGGQLSQKPFSLVRSASPATRTLWWPAVSVGILCGFLYLAAAASRYRPPEDEPEYAEEIPRPTQRLITAYEPVVPAAAAGNAVRHEPLQSAPYQRASFAYDDPQIGSTDSPITTRFEHIPSGNAPSGLEGGAPAASQDIPSPVDETVAPALGQGVAPALGEGFAPAAGEGIAPVASEGVARAVDEGVGPALGEEVAPVVSEGVAPAVGEGVAHALGQGVAPAANEDVAPAIREGDAAAVGEGDGPASSEPAHLVDLQKEVPLRENVVEIGDSWVDKMNQALSQTKIARMFEGSPTREEGSATNEKSDDSSHSSGRPDRLAG